MHGSPVTKITTKKKKVSPKAMKEDERLNIKKDSTFGSTPRPPNHSPGVIIGDNQVIISKPYNGFEGGNLVSAHEILNGKLLYGLQILIMFKIKIR